MMSIEWELSEGKLWVQGEPLLADVPDTVTAVRDESGVGLFLRFAAGKPLARHAFSVGSLQGIARFTACHRYEPFWMEAVSGTRGAEVPVETQVLLAERPDGLCVLLVPLVDGAFRTALQGKSGEDSVNGLTLIAETGDPAVIGAEVVGLFVAAGANPYALVEEAAKSVMAQMRTGRLRRDKPLPTFVDRFGWCTWDSFYQEVSHDKVRLGLESFVEGGITPKLLILDDGWQSVAKQPSGADYLTSFAANAKFPGDLAPTVRMAKEEFGVEQFLVWHALNGYWGGVDGEALPGYGVRAVRRDFSEGIRHHRPTISDWWGGILGLVAPEHAYRFFHNYHRRLRQQGVDGVKVDTQATLEGVASGAGGRVDLMRSYHEALEGSVQTHFKGELINCMSCASEMLYGALNSTVTRTSTDFWPNRPESHGLHLYVNAQVSLWFGEFVHPDWDMFQSGHAMGLYHAAGRAVGGCPVYVSDKPDAHNFDVLRKLVLPDGTILRADHPGRPTRDCLFHNPTREPVLLKIFNIITTDATTTGLLGVFNARYERSSDAAESTESDENGTNTRVTEPIAGEISPSDVEGLQGQRFAVYAHNSGELRIMARNERHSVTLPELTFEVLTLVPLPETDPEIALIGLTELFNSAGAIRTQRQEVDGVSFRVRTGGKFLAWSAHAPQEIFLLNELEGAGISLPFTYDPDTNGLEFMVPGTGEQSLRVRL